MKTKVYFLITLVFLSMIFLAGCTTEEGAIESAEIYTKALDAMQQANSYAFEMDITQVMQLPKPVPLNAGTMTDKMETQITSTGKAIENPLAMEMTMEMHIPALADAAQAGEFANMEIKMYMLDNQLYMYNPMFGGWIRQDISEYGLGVEQLQGLSQAANDPMYLLNLLGEEGASKASLETVDQHYVLTLKDDDGTLMKKIMSEITNQFGGMFDASSQTEIEEIFKEMEFSKIDYKIWIDKDTYLTTKTYLAYNLTMTIDNETVTLEQIATTTYKDFATFDSIDVPEEAINSAVTMEELFQNGLIQP